MTVWYAGLDDSKPVYQTVICVDYFYSLHVSDSYVSIIIRVNCINTTSGTCHSVQMTVWYAGLDSSKPAYQTVIHAE